MKATSLAYSKFLIKVSDGADPEVFAQPCGLTSRGVNRTATAQETTTPDCDDESKPASVEREIDSLSSSISGSGLVAKESFRFWLDWYMSGQSKKVRIYHFAGDEPDEDDEVNAVGYEEGFFVLTNFNNAGERAKKVTAEVELQSSGEITWTDAA